MRISDWSSDVCSSDLCRHRRQDHRRRIDASGTTASIRLGSSRRRRREHEALSGNRGALLERGSRIAQCWLQGAHVIPFSLFASLLTSSAGALANSLFEGGSPTAFFYRLAWGYLGACAVVRSEEHTSELQSLMRISYAVFCLKKKKTINYT